MNRVAITVISFVLGAGSGVFISRQILKNKYARIADEEIESVKEAFRQRAEENAMAVERAFKEKAEADIGIPYLDKNPYEQAKRKYGLGNGLVREEPIQREADDNGYEEDETADEEDEDDEIRDAAGYTETEIGHMYEPTRGDPYLIDEEAFNNECDHYDKETLFYYKVDGVLCDENEDIVDDVEGTVGDDAIPALADRMTVWVRNEPRSIDYEIVSANKSYAETVAGLMAPPTVRTPREIYEEKQKNRRDLNDEE